MTSTALNFILNQHAADHAEAQHVSFKAETQGMQLMHVETRLHTGMCWKERHALRGQPVHT
jgi:hypothetical protein